MLQRPCYRKKFKTIKITDQTAIFKKDRICAFGYQSIWQH